MLALRRSLKLELACAATAAFWIRSAAVTAAAASSALAAARVPPGAVLATSAPALPVPKLLLPLTFGTTASTSATPEQMASPPAQTTAARSFPWIRPGTTVGATPGKALDADELDAWLLRSSSSSPSVRTTTVVHLIVLVHGWMGNARELGYLQESLQRQAAEALLPGGRGDAPAPPDDDAAAVVVVVHSATCNEGKTFDGVAAGGRRLADEVSDALDDLLKPERTASVTLSFVGNSLGGLYARYALSHLSTRLNSDPRIVPQVFCTTATPHLGVSQHTYLPLPRWVEQNVVAPVMSKTGRDLFRVSSVLDDMARDSSSFATALRRFAHRVAYANAGGSDFQVPTATAAFWDPQSESPHRVVKAPERGAPSFSEHVVLVAETPAKAPKDGDDADGAADVVGDSSSPPLRLSTTELAERLDSLGWTKIVVDVRPLLPSIPLPRGAWHQPPGPEAPGEDPVHTRPVDHQLVVPSRDLHRQYASPPQGRWHAPFGHTILVANSKSDWYSRLNSAGRPVVDGIATNLLQGVLFRGGSTGEGIKKEWCR